MTVYLLYVMYASVPLLLRLLVYRGMSPRDSFFPFPGVVMKLLECIRFMAVPLLCMVFPPTTPEQHELLETDAHGVKRPKKRPDVVSDDTRMAWVDLVELLVIYLCDWC